jgi:endonuclease/exonuclease/phosphatase family metal-dependent hydrolase
MNKLKNILYKYSIKELDNTIIFSSAILFTHGLRENNDLDVIMLRSENITDNEIEIINNTSKDKLDISYEGKFNKEWEDELNNRAIMFGAEDYKELILNPHYHYYFMGLKFLRLKYDIITRIKRNRPAQITDLLILRQNYNLRYKLSIPTQTKTYNDNLKIDEIKDVDENKFINTIKYYLKSRYYINLQVDQIKDWILQEKKQPRQISRETNRYIIQKDISEDKIIYPTSAELIKMGYNPQIQLYSEFKPYLYEGEDIFDIKLCEDEPLNKQKYNNLRIMTFNVHNFVTRCNQGIAPIFGDRLNPYDIPQDINRFIELFKKVNADIICMQEVVPIKDNYEYLNKKMAEIGYKYKIISSCLQGYFYENENKDYYMLGNAIYSKIELTNSEIYQYTFLNRNFITTSIKYKNKTINIVNCHWEYFDDKTDKLIKQAEVFKEVLEQKYKDLHNVIICGDFNLNLYRKNFGIRYNNYDIKTKFIKDNFNMLNKMIPTNFSQEDVTDFILLSKNSDLKQVFTYTIKTSISDHYPVIADIMPIYNG